MRRTLPLVLALLFLPSLASARPNIRLQERITQYAVIISDLQTSDPHKVAGGEIAKLQSWLDEARAQLALEHEEATQRILRRFKPQVQYLRAIIANAAVATKLQTLEERTEALTVEARQLEARSKDLDKRRIELVRQVEHRSGKDTLKRLPTTEPAP